MTAQLAPLFALAAVLPVAVGCDALTAHPFNGTVIQGTFAGVAETPGGQHLELWARNANDDIIRLEPFYDQASFARSYGLVIRQAVTLADPCIIDGAGNLLTSAAAYPSSVTIAGVTQTPDQQAEQVRRRIEQLAVNPSANGALLAVLPYSTATPPNIAADATPAARKAACDDYERDPLAYVPNPLQITAPLHGAIYGVVSFISLTPPANYDGYRLDTPQNLTGVREIFYTLEGPNVDPAHRGPLFMTSTLTPGGHDVVHFDLVHADPAGTATGTASLYVDLAQDPVGL